ncbi:MAG: hypothetical protein C6Y22_22185 [Hapalosiphonaceae cyanobacterium JJU2]|nr:MAG: hypothetical protein C6Y22_22185 [Hapalosiphonaceae cyanobacterium JJU2]
MTWHILSTITLSDSSDWIITPETSSVIFRLTHTSDDENKLAFRGAIAQAFEIPFLAFDSKSLFFKTSPQALLFPLPNGLSSRKLALRKLTPRIIDWNIQIEEFIDPGGLDFSVYIEDVIGLTYVLSNKTDIGHQHLISEVDSLQLTLNAKSEVGHNHQISNISGLESELGFTNLSINPGYVSGRYYTPHYYSGTAGLTTNSAFIYYTYFFINKATTISAIAYNVSTAGSSGSTALIGIYKVINAFPAILIADFGIIPVDTVGTKIKNLSLSLSPGWYAAALRVSSTGVNFTAGNSSIGILAVLGATSVLSSTPSGFCALFSGNTLPLTAPLQNFSSINVPLVWYKIQ